LQRELLKQKPELSNQAKIDLASPLQTIPINLILQPIFLIIDILDLGLKFNLQKKGEFCKNTVVTSPSGYGKSSNLVNETIIVSI
jgi:hypothetical protein